jgi:hypothetical protein
MPTPPLLPSNISDNYVPETPLNITKFERQTKVIKDYIERHITNLLSLTDITLNQLVKGCQLAIHSAVLLAEENKQLRSANERQKRKNALRGTFVATRGGLTVQGGLD